MLGDTLRREREKQGLTIKDIENETSIRSLYIEAIEKGDYEHLPGDVYTKGFIRNYAKALNLDSTSLLEQYNSERNIEVPVQPVDMQTRESYYDDVPQRTVTVKSSSYSSRGHEGGNLFSSGDDYRERTEEKGGSRKFLILLAIMVVFLGGVYYAFSDDPAQSKEKAKPTVKTEKVVNQAKQEEPAPVEKKFDDVQVVAKFTGPCWVSVKADGKEVFEGTVDSGKDMSWKGNEKVELTAGNAGAIELTWNGKNLGILGDKGQVVERVMTKDSDGAKAAADKAAKDAKAADKSADKSTKKDK
ncbi:helix-turn-helix domain protein [Anaerovibrio sp. JC8]|uniref:helix-turn-helix domain-containing protein n=1 Tax=Anaerovibrio sp. JC8 TaxID=1240085 RepID=UPI000A0D76FB|nr:RodZ domain-containing protein [Anaerovibrio sp. JC8]ORU00707.1 helix-turn-helix domain protein [Anaerovibrio sp. JC8]